jgi:hypothetical protein
MMKMLRSIFGLNEPAENRTVVGNAVNVDAKDVQYIRNSNARLTMLHTLCSRYKGTPHAQQLEAVFEKTKHIHHFLLTRKRAHELELFHVRNTDHFINTFTVILDVYQRHTATTFAPLKEAPKVYRAPKIEQPAGNLKSDPFASKVDTMLRRIESETVKGIYTAQKVTEMVKRVAGQAPYVQADGIKPPIPAVSVPIISIDTYSKITYVREDAAGVRVSGQIGFTSTAEEMETFVAHVSERLGIDRSVIAYIGNAMVAIPDRKGPNPARYVPILNWKGCTYALNLHDFLLFPVRAYRRSH